MFDHEDGVLLLISFAFFAPDTPLIHGSKKFQLSHHSIKHSSRTPHVNISAYSSCPFMFFLVKSGIWQDVPTWSLCLSSILMLLKCFFLLSWSSCKSLRGFFSVALIKHFIPLNNIVPFLQHPQMFSGTTNIKRMNKAASWVSRNF